jgi:hypothetical protein
MIFPFHFFRHGGIKAKITGVGLTFLAFIGAVCWATEAQSEGQSEQASAASSDQTSRSVWDGVYTTEQAERGAAIAVRECATCHGATLSKADEGPSLAGESFLAEWDGQDLGGLYERMSNTMPQSDPGKLKGQEYVDILAQILRLNKFPAGKTELEGRPESLKQIRIEAINPKAKRDPGTDSKARNKE